MCYPKLVNTLDLPRLGARLWIRIVIWVVIVLVAGFPAMFARAQTTGIQ